MWACCIEFVLTDGSLVVNEMAPRPHNSGHYTMDACVTSQFAAGARHGAPAAGRCAPAFAGRHAQHLGDVWFEGDSGRPRASRPGRVLALPGANLHLYGKDDPRRARKMGHLTFIAPTLAQAQQQRTPLAPSWIAP
jgi:5-(carboxyamino)imidazole ribonucleotide synthase